MELNKKLSAFNNYTLSRYIFLSRTDISKLFIPSNEAINRNSEMFGEVRESINRNTTMLGETRDALRDFNNK